MISIEQQHLDILMSLRTRVLAHRQNKSSALRDTEAEFMDSAVMMVPRMVEHIQQLTTRLRVADKAVSELTMERLGLSGGKKK